MIDTFEFSVITGDKMTPSLWREASDLFSSEYGFYSASAPQRAGQQIRMGVRYYQGAYASFSLRPSKTMWEDGEFFRPKCVLVDRMRGLVCHKEQFPASDASLPGEYLIRDRRFRLEEIVAWAEECGLTVAAHHFVRAGFKAELPEGDGKEILLITRRDEGEERHRLTKGRTV